MKDINEISDCMTKVDPAARITKIKKVTPKEFYTQLLKQTNERINVLTATVKRYRPDIELTKTQLYDKNELKKIVKINDQWNDLAKKALKHL